MDGARNLRLGHAHPRRRRIEAGAVVPLRHIEGRFRVREHQPDAREAGHGLSRVHPFHHGRQLSASWVFDTRVCVNVKS